MIEKLLESISFESTLTYLMAYLESSVVESSKGVELVRKEGDFVLIRDLDVLRALISADDMKEFLSTGLGQHLLSFCLRHQITKMQILSLWEALDEEDQEGLLITDEERSFFIEHTETVSKDACRLIFGFNIKGILLAYHEQDSCVALDGYDLKLCQEQGGILCKAHQNEAWWRDDKDPAFSLSKMYRFYRNLENADDYSEEDLNHMVHKFWQKMKTWQNQNQGMSISDALDCFGISSVSELHDISDREFKGLYHKKSLSLHPDRGGTTEGFIRLKASFDRLSFARRTQDFDSRNVG